jgi:hypothetical protein
MIVLRSTSTVLVLVLVLKLSPVSTLQSPDSPLFMQMGVVVLVVLVQVVVLLVLGTQY